MSLLCCGCDTERETIRAFCPSCAEVTESYEFTSDGSIRGADLTRYEAETIASLGRTARAAAVINLPARMDRIAARRAA